jgi:hypothetical protein
MSIQFHPTTDTQKLCTPPLLNASFGKRDVPIINYTHQMKTGQGNQFCSNPVAPYLFFDEENSKYCCSSEIQNVDFVLYKIERDIQLHAQNSCSQTLYNKYKPFINALMRDYMAIYKKKYTSLVSADELAQLVTTKKAELLQLSAYHEDDSVSCSENPDDLGVDDQVLMANLFLAQEYGPKRRSGSSFFDSEGGKFSQKKKSKKQTNIRKYRRSAKLYKH